MSNRALATRTSLALLAWSASASCQEEKAKVCALLSISECASRPYCVVMHAQRAEIVEQCLAASEPVACTGLEGKCGGALTVASDGDDELFVLPNTCLPTGWEAESDPGGEVVNWPDCQ